MSELTLRSLFAVLARIPLPVQYLLGSLIGNLLALFPNRHRRVTMQNLALCFPDAGENVRSHLMFKSMREMARTALETPLICRANRTRLTRLIRQVHGEHHLEQALVNGKGVIIASPHLGSWELVGQFLQSRAPLVALFKPSRHSAVNKLMSEGRAHLGIRMAPADKQGVREVYAHLKRGGMVGILPDQNPGKGAGVFVPFFGISTLTMTLLSKLAMRSNVPVLVCYAQRLSWGRGYEIHILPCPEASNSSDVHGSATALNHTIETAVRDCPEQYQWSYKRFRSRPEGEAPRYTR